MSHSLSRDALNAGMDLYTATVTLGCSCSNMSFSTSHNTFRDNPAQCGFTHSHRPLRSKPAPTGLTKAAFPPGESLFHYGLVCGNVL